MKITWAEAGYPAKRANIPWFDGELVIEQKHIDNWYENPDAVYEVSFAGVFGGIKKYILGAWEIE